MAAQGAFVAEIRQNGAAEGCIDKDEVIAIFRDFEEGAKQFRDEEDAGLYYASLVGHDEAMMLRLACALRGIIPALDNFQVRGTSLL